VAQIADWARVGAWSLLPQALLAVLLTLMASTGRLRHAVLAYGLALLLVAAGAWLGDRFWGLSGGGFVMGLVNVALGVAALALCVLERENVRSALVWRDLLPAALAAAGVAALGAGWQHITSRWDGLLLAVLAAGAVVGVAWLTSPGLRRALRR
jgi:hypothetical protein